MFRGKNVPLHDFKRFYASNLCLLILWSRFYAYILHLDIQQSIEWPYKDGFVSVRDGIKSLIMLLQLYGKSRSHSSSDWEDYKECAFSLYWPWLEEFNPSYKEPFHHINRFSCIWASLILGMWIYRRVCTSFTGFMCPYPSLCEVCVYVGNVCCGRASIASREWWTVKSKPH